MRTTLAPTLLPARRRRVAPLLVAGIAGAAAALLLARAAERRDTAPLDEKARRGARKGRRDHRGLHRAATAVSPAGKWWGYLPASVVVGAAIARRAEERRPGLAAGAAVVTAALLAAGLNKHLEEHLPQPPAPPGRDSPDKPVFPSGHTLGPAAVALTAAWVGARERCIPALPGVAAALLVPVVTATQRVLDEMHWASDVAGGYAAGLSVAAAAGLVYEYGAG